VVVIVAGAGAGAGDGTLAAAATLPGMLVPTETPIVWDTGISPQKLG